MSSGIVFLVDEAPEGRYTARAPNQGIFTESETPEELETSSSRPARLR